MQPARSLGVKHVQARTSGRSGLRWRRWVLASIAPVGVLAGLAVAAATPAYASGSITISPSSGLTNGTTVTVTGSGFTANSIGNILECNSDANQPTVHLGGVVNSDIPVSCIAPSLQKLVTVSGAGAVSGTFSVIQGTVGPPCGPTPAAVTCPATDNANNSPAADAAKYPCPPTAAQVTAGDVCQLTYGDEANDSAVATLNFASAPAPTTTAAPTTTRPPAATTTTVAHATASTTATTTPDSPATTAAPATSSSSSSSTGGTLASTGPGPDLWVVGIIGFVALYLGAVVLALVDRPRTLLYRLTRRSGVPGAAAARPEFSAQLVPASVPAGPVGAVPAPMAPAPRASQPSAPASKSPTWAVPPDEPAVFYPRSSGPPGLWVE